MFLSPNIVAKLSEWTNRRAEMYFEQNTNTRTVYGVQWKKLEKEEMYVFIALHILTGLVKCSRITDYWSNNILCAGPKVFNKSIMSRNRYLSILKFIRFSPPEAARNNAPLSRLEIYMSMLKDNCKTLVDPGPVFAREVILDNWYTSVRLSQFLLTQGTYVFDWNYKKQSWSSRSVN
ncbi:unnamed protein product [Acanthoscelides obtectus]|uniref:PiggyBac transposable element-derived protein domain-containing protein n=1 Tax=Acanthoscelides obtectus TaxID=200917 RepID=A0A9P0LMP4_ACAOB|nr:unnamed protein product [Acanthoscelides obtectus]CAK1673035.1 hypothetical protein AOBTE_LOCUS29214 [Acanthoscelides obtectus]